jgi:hypothetical protein
MGKHIATAFADYTDVWGLSDKVFYSTLLNVIELELMFLIKTMIYKILLTRV